MVLWPIVPWPWGPGPTVLAQDCAERAELLLLGIWFLFLKRIKIIHILLWIISGLEISFMLRTVSASHLLGGSAVPLLNAGSYASCCPVCADGSLLSLPHPPFP